MDYVYLFDVDGTLTPPRMPMEAEFAEFFLDFVNLNKVVLVSGSDYKKIEEQVPEEILKKCDGIYGCSGAEYFENGRNLYTKQHKFPYLLRELCEAYVLQSPYEHRCGNHIEERPGMLNVSVVGRDATNKQRKDYHAWDAHVQERLAFVDIINSSVLPYEASAGGEISIDIVPKGWNKSVVKDEVLSKYPSASLIFFGDRIVPNGNDLPLSEALEIPEGKHMSQPVNSYHDTWKILEVNTAILNAIVA